MSDKPPSPMVVKRGSALSPLTPYDAEELDAYPQGTEFEITPTTKRTNRHLNTYWSALGKAVKATGRWPNAEHLHNELKWACGFRQTIIDWDTGDAREVLDSVAMNKMDHQTFKLYFDMSMAKLSEAVGYDPLEWLSQ